MSSERAKRWRLILGKAAEQSLQQGMNGGQPCLGGDLDDLDEALGFIYGQDGAEGQMPGKGQGAGKGQQKGKRSAGLGKSAPQLAKWLGDLRGYFTTDVVAIVQKDAIERKGLKQLLFEPETLGQVTPSVEMVGTLLSLKNLIPEDAKEAARQMVQAVVEEIIKRLKGGIEQAIRGSLDRSRHSPIRCLPNMDWPRTIRRNLRNYNHEHKVIIPDQFFFFARQHRRKEYHVIVCMDQSGSMAESCVWGGVMGAILASMPALETKVIAFDTEVVDLTEQCSDPVDLLFGVMLGGGTDINRAVKYCQELITDPRKTIFLLLTDLYEGGNASELCRRMEDMVQSGVRAITLLALGDHGAPCYDEHLAKRFANIGVPSFACTPGKLPELLEGTLKGQDLFKLAQSVGVPEEKK
jgi:hypothetical protein